MKNTKNKTNKGKNKVARKTAAPTPPRTGKKGPGRPKAQLKWPAVSVRFTRDDVYQMNPSVAPLTVIKQLDALRFMKDETTGKIDRSRKRRSSPLEMIVGEFGAPKNELGLGRKPNVYRFTAAVPGMISDAAEVPAPDVAAVVTPPVAEVIVEVTAPSAELVADVSVDVGTAVPTPVADAPAVAETAPEAVAPEVVADIGELAHA